ncbi:MAG: multiprotein-bridging factor 1 family protein [Candidatus Aenigmarchaeota archaeon]|nr:multiprotein-bridging factor 1 family protein [Candidatus Aenigmarchaeota archaeon]
MGECEVCGRHVSSTKKSEIDGVVLEVCNMCSGLGEERAQPKTLFVRKRPDYGDLDEEKVLVSDFASKVRNARQSKNFDQEEAARKMGISSSVLKRIEGGSKMDDRTMKKIQRFYGINLYETLE